MYLKEISVTNYRSFHGEHVLRFRRGANIVVGGSGSGKTNLCGAIEFALFGGMSEDTVELPGLINRERVDEANPECMWVGCEVSLLFMDEAGEHRVKRSFSLFGEDEAVEKTYYSRHVLPKISRCEYREYVHVDEDLSGLRRTGTSARVDGERALEFLSGLAERNVASGFGVMLLDNSLSRLPACDGEKVLKGLVGSGLDQVILLVHPSGLLSEGSAYHLGKTIEAVTFKVMGFPFDSSCLRRGIEQLGGDSYVARGDMFERDVYGHWYTMEAVEVAPDGARFQAESINLKIL